MNISDGVVDMITWTADATTAVAGAVGGAAVNGVIGGIQGVADGVKSGLSSGSHSAPAAALTVAAIGAAGLVEWPVLLSVGGAALVVHQINQRSSSRPSPDGGGRPARLEPVSEGDRTPRRGDEDGTTAQKAAPRPRRSPSAR
ncbi:hypothetical protein AB0L63_13675 [Nocardia sp. NPDC051990]|uniref:hypothetical protein n=1 Tax=Nocardia sp. NPDC051990 TaxID=3155285 RepID=UPI0034134FC4